MRSSAIQPAPVRVTTSVGALLQRFTVAGSSPERLAQHLSVAAGQLFNDSRSLGEQRQLFGRDHLRNKAVEERAVGLVTERFTTRDCDVVSRESENIGYDLDCTHRTSGSVRHVEVKGTTGRGEEVLVSVNEVNYARSHPDTADLFIVAGIKVTSDEDGLPVAGGGTVVHHGPWTKLETGLTPTGFSYAH